MDRDSRLRNLNELRVDHALDSARAHSLIDYSVRAGDGLTQVYFRDLEARLIEHIDQAEYVVGAVAWLTSIPVLRALKGVRGVSIIVQKQFYLRSDYRGEHADFYRNLRGAYYGLPAIDRRRIGGRMSGFRLRPYVTQDEEEAAIRDREVAPTLYPIQCLGYDPSGGPRTPLLHNKYLVFCRSHAENGLLDPYAVWTGSYNFTANARASLENAVVMRQPEIVSAFFQHYVQLAALSEPPEWSSTLPDPAFFVDASDVLDELSREEEARLQQEYEEAMRALAELANDPGLENEAGYDRFPRRSANRSRGGWDDWQQDERHWLR
jgi:hypothetical protein